MDRFLEMQTFDAVVEAGSFAGGAEALAHQGIVLQPTFLVERLV